MSKTFVLAVLSVALPAAAQTNLYGFRANGDLLRIEPVTGVAALIGNCGFPCGAVMSREYGPPGLYGPSNGESLVITGGTPATASQLLEIDRWTGANWRLLTNSAVPAGYAIHAMAGGSPLAILRTINPPVSDVLSWLNGSTWTVIGPTGRGDLESIAMGRGSVSGILFGLGSSGGGALYSINTTTGAATFIGGGNFGGDVQGLACMPDGTLLAAGSNLRSVSPSTGGTTLIGPIGFSDLRGLSTVSRAACYINCDVGQAPPPLNANDFQCFLNRFVIGDPYANCDQSTTPPILNVNDFMCFMNAWTLGCS